MSRLCRLTLGAYLVAFGLGCRASRPPAQASASPTDVLVVPTPPAPPSPPHDASSPADAATEDVPPNVATQRAVMRACPAPAGTPPIGPEPESSLGLPGPWTPAARRSPPNDVAAPVATACAAMEARRRASLASVGPGAPSTEDDPHVEAVGRCFHAGRGAWVLEPGAARVRRGRDLADEPIRWIEVGWTLAFVQPDGRVLRRRIAGARASWSVFFDFDGDGTAEAGLRIPGGGDHARSTLYTVHDGAIVPYAPGAGVDAEVPHDVDGDGRPDFLTDSPFTTPNTCGPSVFYGVPEVVHALADGGFSRDDAVAREWMRQRCAGVTPASAERLIEGGPPFREIVGRIGCLRYLGVPAEALQRALDAQWPAESTEDHCWSRPAVVASLRAARVPFQVPPCDL